MQKISLLSLGVLRAVQKNLLGGWHPPMCGRGLSGGNFDQKFSVAQIDGETFPLGLRRPSFPSYQLALITVRAEVHVVGLEPTATGFRAQNHSPRSQQGQIHHLLRRWMSDIVLCTRANCSCHHWWHHQFVEQVAALIDIQTR